MRSMRHNGTIDEASREICRDLVRARLRSLERARIQHLLTLTDATVDELERLNLNEVERLSGEWRERLALLFAELPFPYIPWVRAHPSPTEVLDVLFDIQGRLLDLKRRQFKSPRQPVPVAGCGTNGRRPH
jgi:hypothetical protein